MHVVDWWANNSDLCTVSPPSCVPGTQASFISIFAVEIGPISWIHTYPCGECPVWREQGHHVTMFSCRKKEKKIIMFPHSLSPRFFSDLLKSVMPFSRWRAGWLSNSRGIFLLTGCWSCWKWFKSLLFQHHAFVIFQPPVRPIPPFLTIRCLIISRIHASIFSSSDISLTSSSLHIVMWFCILSQYILHGNMSFISEGKFR